MLRARVLPICTLPVVAGLVGGLKDYFWPVASGELRVESRVCRRRLALDPGLSTLDLLQGFTTKARRSRRKQLSSEDEGRRR